MNYYRGVLVSVDEGKAKLTRSDNGEEVIIDEAKLCWYVFLYRINRLSLHKKLSDSLVQTWYQKLLNLTFQILDQSMMEIFWK